MYNNKFPILYTAYTLLSIFLVYLSAVTDGLGPCAPPPKKAKPVLTSDKVHFCLFSNVMALQEVHKIIMMTNTNIIA